MIDHRLKRALSAATLCLALLPAAPIALADPPGYLFQDFEQPQANAHKEHIDNGAARTSTNAPATPNAGNDVGDSTQDRATAPSAADPATIAARNRAYRTQGRVTYRIN